MIQAEQTMGKRFVREPGVPTTSVSAPPVKSQAPSLTLQMSSGIKNPGQKHAFFSVSLEAELS